MKASIFTGIVSSAAVLVTACSGGNGSATSLPAADVLSAIPGVYRKTSISAEGKTVTCPAYNELVVGTTTGTIAINNVVVDTCSPDDALILGASTSADGSGRYRIVTASGTEDGKYYPAASSITLVRDRVNGTALPATAPRQRTVLSATLTPSGVVSITPVPQPVTFKQTGTTSPFNADGSLNAAAIAPVLNADGSINTVVLTQVNDVATLNADLTVTVAPVANANAVIAPPGIPSVRGTTQNLVKQVFAPDEVPPTPAPAP